MIQIKETYEIIGDVNLFFNQEKIAEINIMISEHKFRGRGYATEVLDALIPYGNETAITMLLTFI